MRSPSVLVQEEEAAVISKTSALKMKAEVETTSNSVSATCLSQLHSSSSINSLTHLGSGCYRISWNLFLMYSVWLTDCGRVSEIKEKNINLT